MRRRHVALVVLVGLASRGSAQDRRVIIDRVGYRFGSVGETVAAKAGVLDASLIPVPNARIRWRIDHPAIATVSRRGIVRARAVGYTRLWAVSGRDSGSAVILVKVSRNLIDFSPSPLRFEKVGQRRLLRIQLVYATASAPADLTGLGGPCRSRNDLVASLSGDGEVLSRGTGVTYIQCTSRGVSDSVRVEVGQGEITVAAAAATLRVSVLPAHATFRPDILAALPYDTSRVVVPVVRRGSIEVASKPQQEQRAAPAPRDSAAAAADLRTASRLAGRLVSVMANASHTTHSAQLAQGISERRAGLLAGGTASLAPRAAWLATGDFRVGTLSGGDTFDGDLRVTEAMAQLTYWSARWLGVRGGYTLRSENANLVLQRWQFINVTALSRFAFREGAITSVAALSLLPWGSFTGHLDNEGKPVAPNKTSFAFETGLEFDLGQMRAGIIYGAERFAFPDLNGTARRDRFSTLRIRVGIQTGPWNQPTP